MKIHLIHIYEIDVLKDSVSSTKLVNNPVRLFMQLVDVVHVFGLTAAR